MRFGQLVLPMIIAATVFSAPVLAQDSERVARMQQTIQELTLQLGDAIRENAALRRQIDGHHHDPMPAQHHCEPLVESMPVAPHHPIHPIQPAQPVARAPQSGQIQTVPTEVNAPMPLACDVDELKGRLAEFSDATTRASTLNNWVSDHGGKCSRAQLVELQKVANGVILSDDALALIDYYLSNVQ